MCHYLRTNLLKNILQFIINEIYAGIEGRFVLSSNAGKGLFRKQKLIRVGSFGRVEKKSSDLIDQEPASIVGGADGSSLARKDVCNDRHFHVIPVTPQATISPGLPR